MKSVLVILSIVLGSLVAQAECGSDHKKSSQNRHAASVTTNTEAKTIEVKVTGMSCAACVDKLTGEVAKINQAEGVVINVTKNLVTVDYSKSDLSGNKLKKLQNEVKAAVAAAKFQVAG